MTIGQALTEIKDEQLHKRKTLVEILLAVKAIVPSPPDPEVRRLLEAILAAVTIEGEPESPPQLTELVDRAAAVASRLQGQADRLKAAGEIEQ